MTVPQCRKTLLIISKGQPPSPYQLYTNGQSALIEQKSPVENLGLAMKNMDNPSFLCSVVFVWEKGGGHKFVGSGFLVCDLVLTFRIIWIVLQQGCKEKL